MKGVYFITGIDTNIGKSIATGWLAARLIEQGLNVITQKMIQTGDSGISEDIEMHRKLMNTPFTEEDRDGTTCPIVLSYPASPHLAAKIDRVEIEISLIETSTECLSERYDVVLLEGAGGAMVPLTDNLLTIDYVAERGYPAILVTSGRLGSINHTILTIEALLNRKVELHSIIYNRYPQCDSVIEEDTLEYIKSYLSRVSPKTQMVVMEAQTICET